MKVVIIQSTCEDVFHIYNEAGEVLETGFDSAIEATDFALANGYIIVDSFNS